MVHTHTHREGGQKDRDRRKENGVGEGSFGGIAAVVCAVYI